MLNIFISVVMKSTISSQIRNAATFRLKSSQRLLWGIFNHDYYFNLFKKIILLIFSLKRHLIKIATYVKGKLPQAKILFWDDMMHGMPEKVLETYVSY